MSAALRARRAAAARAIEHDARRAQVGWDDLAAWPAWTALDTPGFMLLAARSGAWLHAAGLRRCIAGPVLQRVRQQIGDAAFERLVATAPDADGDAEFPAADGWLQHEGREALIASVASPVLRVLLRERHAPDTLPPLPALDSARARRAVDAALELQ